MNIPRATYRVQLHRDFTFNDARAIVPYLAALGVSHLYTSPFLKARPGSTHGYDVVDHEGLNPEIGNESDLDALVSALREHGMGLMLDLVPNHMGVLKADNRWWLDALEYGQASHYAGYFDIDWERESDHLAGKVLLPILGDHYGTVLERGEIELRFDAGAGAFSLWYYDHRMPVRPHDYPRLLVPDAADPDAGGETGAALRELADEFAAVPVAAPIAGPPHAAATLGSALKSRLAALCAKDARAPVMIASNLRAYKGVPGEAGSFDTLHALIEGQAYRLAHWRVAADDINYRRFFEVNDLAALRAEREDVFEDTHRYVLKLVAQGKADSLRIDHPDGLHDPCEYFARLQAAAARAMDRPDSDELGRSIYLVIEKIIADHERLPLQWPVHGTTGYRFMNVVNGLFVDTSARARFDRLYAGFVDERMDFDEVLRRCRTLIIVHSLAGELNQLATALTRLAKRDRRTCDFTRNSIRRALVDVAASFPVYRTYISAAGLSADDRRHVDWAIAVAKRQSAAAETSVFDFIGATLRGELASTHAGVANEALRFTQRFQQFLAPVKAKGMEDTAFYVYTRLASLNEVGGDPRTFGFTVQAFHGATQDRAKHWPHTMLATSTHDNKRSEDVRTRIDVLSEMPAAWRLSLRRWRQLNRRHRTAINGADAPSRNDEYLLYQTLLGAWPLEALDDAGLEAFRKRIQAYMQKAAREAKMRTSWVNPQADYEAALDRFIEGILAQPERNHFLQDFLPAQQRIARHGAVNSLAQTLIKCTSPGVPDTYQGTELWDFSLVDPDNRRPVDYALRRTLLGEVTRADAWQSPAGLLENWQDGRVKLWLTARLLDLRRERAHWFERAAYQPVAVQGAHAHRVCAFVRSGDGRRLLSVVPRLWFDMVDDASAWPLGRARWGDTVVAIPGATSRWHNLLTGEHGCVAANEASADLAVADLLATFPVALIELDAEPAVA